MSAALADSGVVNGVQIDGNLVIAVRPGAVAAGVIAQPGAVNSATWQGYTGWTRTRLTTGIETFPSDFELEATDNQPGATSSVDIMPGYECYIKIGTELVLTGYIDAVSIELTPTGHVVRITGRSKCCDLVDCSAEFSTFQLTNTNPLNLATVLSAKYGITVSTIGVLANLAIPSFDITLTQTPYEVIEQVARYAQLLVYDGTDGNLILAQAGATSMASGFTQGLNVQEASVTFSMDERYSSVEAVTCATDTLLTDPDNQNFSAEAGLNGIAASISYDKGVPRYRPLIIIAEQGDTNYAVTIARSQWEINRRIGRSQAVRVMTDSWFDSSGKLWAKNALAPINLPSLKITNQNWLIGSVTFTRDEGGTRADLVLMPQAAFQPEPVLLLPYNGEITQAENAGAAATDIDPDAPGPLVGFTPGGAQ